ncbi:uncharacterized protein LOC131684572 [Topomyia yanbarensis]|uniref:uncharacterized protein LOC131684572 n=1 Tax=Topomyia yanbarensis TaxID=2498891 RepID=UPI00273ADA21|nr:uncharacterized protein LOC131684572 [Topomyia yanbarensis]
MGWIRPQKPTIPTVWHTFQARDVDSDRTVTYRVEDLTEDRHDDLIRFLSTYFLEDEPQCQNKQISQDEVALAEMVSFWRWCFAEKMTIVCYREGSNEIVGANLLQVKGREKPRDINTNSEKLLDMIMTNRYMTEQFKVCEQYGVDWYLNAYGLAINRCYRGRGIATEILRARVPICQTFGIKVTTTIFTSLGSQLAAAKVGFNVNFEMTYDDFAKMGPRYSYAGIQSKSSKLMSLKID